MAARTLRLAVEKRLPPLCREVERLIVLRRLRGGNRELVEVERGQLRSDQIGIVAHVRRACFGRHWELCWIIEPRIVECSFAVHLQVRDKRIPISGRTESGPGAKVHSSEAEGRWNQHGSGFSVRTEGLAIQGKLRIEFPWAPTIQDGSHGCIIDSQKIREHAQVGGQSYDGSDIEIPVCPTIPAVADTRSERIIHRRVAQARIECPWTAVFRPVPKNPVTPTTAFKFSNATVVAGSVRSTVPFFRPSTTD